MTPVVYLKLILLVRVRKERKRIEVLYVEQSSKCGCFLISVDHYAVKVIGLMSVYVYMCVCTKKIVI